MKFTVTISDHPQHGDVFLDVAHAIVGALRELGHEVTTDGRVIMLCGGHVDPARLPPDAIVFNTEQVTVEPTSRTAWLDGARERWARHFFLDYSAANVAALRARGIRVAHCPLGYTPRMERQWPSAVQDIDVLWYGANTNWRRPVLEAFTSAPLRTCMAYGVYGAERDRLIARSKVVLNLHAWAERPIFEVFRASLLWSNRKCLVSEDGSVDPELEALAQRASVVVPRDQIVEACRELVANSARRRDVEERGHAAWRETDLAANLARALAEIEVISGLRPSSGLET